MTTATPRQDGSRWAGLLACLLACAAPAPAEPPDAPPRPDLSRPPIVPPEAVRAAAAVAPPPGPAGSRLRLFRIQPGFLSDVPWLELEEPPEPRPADTDGEERITLNVGSDNPYFDFRRRGDPGGVGFMRVNTQVGLFDTGRTACTLGVQAVTPAGHENQGLPEHLGPTVVMPALSIYHALDDGLAVQAFVGKQLPVMNATGQPVRRDVQYGVAVQRPLAPGGTDVLANLYLSVGALGLYRAEKETRAPVVWELLPGLHYKVTESWWISGGVSLPVGAARAETGQQWQVTCSLQF